MTQATNTQLVPATVPQANHPPFVSYAQNFEDIMLRRALGHVIKGHYLDIGAGEPDADSVTLAFYKAGWRGTNVEPLTGPYSRLVTDRPHDLNLNLAVGSAIGEAVLYVVGAESGLSTLDATFAERYASEGWPIEERRVPVTTLANLCSNYSESEIHFLKIDAEGAELDILEGADFAQWRPWIVLIESTLPNSQITAHEVWEDILTRSRYEFCYFDGLNRFYISEEMAPSLRSAFSIPPNITDNFVLARMTTPSNKGLDAERQRLLDVAQERADEAQARVHAAQAALDTEQSRVAAAEARVDHAQGVSYAALNRVTELQGDVKTLEDRLSIITSENRILTDAVCSLENKAKDLVHNVDQARTERDLWAQELFESNRFSAQLITERQLLREQYDQLSHQTREAAMLNTHTASVQHAELTCLQHAERTLSDKVDRLRLELDHKVQEVVYFKGSFEAVVNSTSWLLTKPLRVLGRLVRR
jgi:FkbM family methyltransferase